MRKPFGTLLAVTLATAIPTIATAGPDHAHHDRAKAAPAKPVPAKPVVKGAKAATAKPAPTAAMKPRQLPTGAPACGNVQSKMSPAQAEAREKCLRGEGK